jgi:hypothetical protein
MRFNQRLAKEFNKEGEYRDIKKQVITIVTLHNFITAIRKVFATVFFPKTPTISLSFPLEDSTDIFIAMQDATTIKF